VHASADDATTSTPYVGYYAYVLTGLLALRLCASATDIFNARTLGLQEATAVACSVFVERAFDLVQRPSTNASAPFFEAGLVRNAQVIIEEGGHFRAGDDWQGRIVAAWRRLQGSGVLQRRGILEAVSFDKAYDTRVNATAAATAAALGLRLCALHTCGAQEVHAAQFKRCSACSGAFYCCKEHQVQGWPAHKAACRAARKAAEAADNEAGGA
jgi:hypothetical protein